MESQGYYRFPTISGNRVVFVSEDDLFEVSTEGGVARRLTAGFGRVSRPLLSSDGQWLAFVGHEEGDAEIYLMPGAGGEVRRLTYLGGGAVPVAFDGEEHLIFLSHHGQPFASQNRLYRVPVTGGQPELLPFGHANGAAFSPGGGVVLNWWARDPADWKRYRGGRRGVLWIDGDGSGSFERCALDAGNLASPQWVGGRIFFLSDHEGIGNLYSMTAQGTDMKRHTWHRRFYARNAASDGRRIVYHAGGDLYLFDPETAQDSLIPVTYLSQRRQRQVKQVDAALHLTEFRPGPDGRSMTVVTRGKPFTMAAFDGPVRQIGAPQGVRYRLMRWIGSQSWLMVSDAGGEDGLEIHRIGVDGLEQVTRIAGDFGLAQHLEVSPDGIWAALSNERFEVWLIDLTAKSARMAAKSEFGAAQGLAWSPDGHWLAYSIGVARNQSAIFLYDCESGSATQVTEPVLVDRSPVFDPRGRYLYLISKRTFNPVNDAVRFDRAFLKAEKIYALTLRTELRSPFASESPFTESEEADGDRPDGAAVDLADLSRRMVELPMDAQDIDQLAASADRIFWTSRDPEDPPVLYGKPKTTLTLHQYDLKTHEKAVLATHISSFELSGDGRVMVVRSGESLRVLEAGRKVEKSPDEKPGRSSGLVDLSRVRVSVRPEAEWQQMLRESWRLMRALFWTPNMSGVDWDGAYEKYRVLVPRLSSRSELSDLFWEMHGELGTSHAYEMDGDYYANPSHAIGYLGADYRWNAERSGYEITRIIAGDVWAQGQHSPLIEPGVNVHVGDVLTAIDGVALEEHVPPGAHLLDTGRREVLLTVVPQSGGSARSVSVRALAEETPARYREWVEMNRRLVHERTGGRVGYLHIPDMQNPGFAEFHRGFLQELGREGLVVDVRFNRGGSVSSLLLEELSRRRLGYMVPRYGKPGTYFREGGPLRMVALTNEFAGSDGDIVSHTWKMLGLGPLIGTRTWGGVVGINPQYRLADGTMTTQPYTALWFYDVEWGVENYGTDPNIEVHNRPQDQARGWDAQLERGIEEIQRLLLEDPPVLPAFDRRPDLSWTEE